MTRTLSVLAVVAVLILGAGQALAAADPAGDWIGTLQTKDRRVVIGLGVRGQPGRYQAVYNDMTQDFWNIPMSPLRTDAGPVFELVRWPVGTFQVRWDPSAGVWRGAWKDKYRAWPLVLRRGAIPPAPLFTRSDKITLAGASGFIVLMTAGIVRLLQLRRRRAARVKGA
jgi:hypothetical protein